METAGDSEKCLPPLRPVYSRPSSSNVTVSTEPSGIGAPAP
jgi:hypothetical protein